MDYLRLLSDLGIDLVAITVLAYVIYFRRHRRRDLMLAYVALNVGIFVVVAMLVSQRLGVAVGFGLFAILSIIRLRSSSITQEEVAYYFVALALGLVNGVQLAVAWLPLALSAVLLAVMYVADHQRLLDRNRRTTVTLDTVHPSESALRLDLERRLGGQLQHLVVTSVDYVREVTVVDVRYRTTGQGGVAPDRRQLATEVTR